MALPASQVPPLPLPLARAIMTLCGTNRNADMLDVRLSTGSAAVLAEAVELVAPELLAGAVEWDIPEALPRPRPRTWPKPPRPRNLTGERFDSPLPSSVFVT
jgi:hypothetical protein